MLDVYKLCLAPTAEFLIEKPAADKVTKFESFRKD